MTPAYYYDEFPSRVTFLLSYNGVLLFLFSSKLCEFFLFFCICQDLFDGASDHARSYNALLWEAPDDSKKMRLVVRTENHVHMREYLSRQKQQASGIKFGQIDMTNSWQTLCNRKCWIQNLELLLTSFPVIAEMACKVIPFAILQIPSYL